MTDCEFRRTVAKTECLTFTWNVEGFEALRKLARLKALPSKDRLFSPEFGSKEAGHWKVALFPFGDREAQKHVSLYLFGDKKQKRVAEFSMVVLDKDFCEMSDTFLGEEPTFFTAESYSWGWHEFLSVETNEELQPYLVAGDCLRVKICVKVYSGVVDENSPRLLFSIVQNRCENSDSGEDCDDSNSEGEETPSCTTEMPMLENKENSHLNSKGLRPGSTRAVSRHPRAESCNGRQEANHQQRSGSPGGLSGSSNRLGVGSNRLPPSSSEAPSSGMPSPPVLEQPAALGASSSSGETQFASAANLSGPAVGSGSDNVTADERMTADEEGSCGVHSSATGLGRRGVRRKSYAGTTDLSWQTSRQVTAGTTDFGKSSSMAGCHSRRRLRRRSSYCCCSMSAAASLVSENNAAVSNGRPKDTAGANNADSNSGNSAVELSLRGRSLSKDVAKFAVDPRVQDMTVICGGVSFPMNRFMMAARSEAFKAMLFGEFAEGRSDSLTISDVSMESIGDFLAFIATDDCPTLSIPLKCKCGAGKGKLGDLQVEPPQASTTNASKDADHNEASEKSQKCTGCVSGKEAVQLVPKLMNLMVAADKYQILELKSRCIQALARCICSKTVVPILDAAELLDCDALTDACNYYLRHNAVKLNRVVASARKHKNRSGVVAPDPQDGSGLLDLRNSLRTSFLIDNQNELVAKQSSGLSDDERDADFITTSFR